MSDEWSVGAVQGHRTSGRRSQGEGASRTLRAIEGVRVAARFWSAAVPCRFQVERQQVARRRGLRTDVGVCAMAHVSAPEDWRPPPEACDNRRRIGAPASGTASLFARMNSGPRMKVRDE